MSNNNNKDEFILEHGDQILVLPVSVTKNEIKQLFKLEDFAALQLDDGSFITDFSTDSSSSELRALRLCDTSAKIILELVPGNDQKTTASQNLVPEKKRSREDPQPFLEDPKRLKPEQCAASLNDNGNVTISEKQHTLVNNTNKPSKKAETLQTINYFSSKNTAAPEQNDSCESEFQQWFSQRPEQLCENDYLLFWDYFFDKLNDCSIQLRSNALERMLQVLESSNVSHVYQQNASGPSASTFSFSDSLKHESFVMHGNHAMSQQH